MDIKLLEKGAIVTTGEVTATVVASISKGWVTLTGVEGKFRAKDLELVVSTGDEKSEDDAEDKAATIAQKMAKKLKEARSGYLPCVTAAGKPSVHNADAVALVLEGCDRSTVLTRIGDLLDMDLAAKYANLSSGAARMNASNRIRGAIRRGDLDISELKSAFGVK